MTTKPNQEVNSTEHSSTTDKHLALVLLALLITGCASFKQTPTAVSQSLTQARATTQPHVPTTLPQTETVTPSSQPSATNFSAARETATKTPQPTIERVAAEKIVQQYIRDNRGCQLPCWWGITPGSTTREEVLTFLEPIGKIEENPGNGYLWFGYQLLGEPEGAYVESTTFFKQGKVSRIFVFSNGTSQRYKLFQLLEEFGKPDEVSLQVYREGFESPLPFDMFVIYRDQGIIARYKAHTKFAEQDLQGCFTYGPDLWLYDVADPNLSDLEFFYNGYAGVGTGPMSPPIHSIDQAAGMSIDQFYQEYRSAGSNCVNTPRDLWPDIGQMESTATEMASRVKTVEPQATQ